MSSNASQKVTFRIAKRHLLPDCSFPPAESGADTALRGGSLRPPRGRKTIYTPSSPPPPPSRSHHAPAPQPPPQAMLPTLPPRRDLRTMQGHPPPQGRICPPAITPPCPAPKARGRRKGSPQLGQGGEERRAERHKPGGRGRGNAFGKKQEGREGNTKKRATTLTATAPINQL